MGIIWTALIGLVVGYIARAVLPGKDNISMPMTAGLGIAAGLLGGFFGRNSGRDFLGMQTGGIFISIILAVVLLLAYRMFNNKK